MTERYLRNKVDGFIYDWNEILAKHPKCEEVTEEQAFPERFVPVERVKQVRKPVGLSTPEQLLAQDPKEPSRFPELDREASRRLPK